MRYLKSFTLSSLFIMSSFLYVNTAFAVDGPTIPNECKYLVVYIINNSPDTWRWDVTTTKHGDQVVPTAYPIMAPGETSYILFKQGTWYGPDFTTTLTNQKDMTTKVNISAQQGLCIGEGRQVNASSGSSNVKLSTTANGVVDGRPGKAVFTILK